MEDNRTDLDIIFNDASESASATAAETSAAEAATAVSSDVERQRDEYRDLLLRKSAEFDNFRKRTERERQMLADAAAADLLGELLPLVDDLERALQVDTASEGTDAYRRGVELIHRQLSETLRKRGVRPLESLGADFDPYYHQAVAHEPDV